MQFSGSEGGKCRDSWWLLKAIKCDYKSISQYVLMKNLDFEDIFN